VRKSPTPDRRLEVGAAQSPHGLKGALSIFSHTRPALGIAGYSFWYIGKDAASAKRFEVVRCWQHGKRLLAELAGIHDADAAAMLKGQTIWVDEAEVPLETDEYLWADLIGCTVCETTGRELGRVVGLESYGAQDILSVRAPDGDWMIPFVESIVQRVDIDGRRIEVELPEGMDACFTPRS
jgi:16S rRNA processing protein RimM